MREFTEKRKKYQKGGYTFAIYTYLFKKKYIQRKLISKKNPQTQQEVFWVFFLLKTKHLFPFQIIFIEQN